MKTIPLLLALSLLLGGCASMKSVATAFVGRKVGVPVAAKTVAYKSAPTTLVATDHTTCNVLAEKFRDTAAGDVIACIWSDREAGLPPSPGLPPAH